MNPSDSIDSLDDSLVDDSLELLDDALPQAESLADDANAVHANREEWLTAAVGLLRPRYAANGTPLPASIRVACGFPSTARRSGAVAEHWPSSASQDATHEVLISPILDNPIEVLTNLIGAVSHACDGAAGNGKVYREIVTAMHLTPGRADFKTVRPGTDFASKFAPILETLGMYPHAALNMSSEKPKQITRLLKAECPQCDYNFRITATWAVKGLPTCICGSKFRLVLSTDQANHFQSVAQRQI